MHVLLARKRSDPFLTLAAGRFLPPLPRQPRKHLYLLLTDSCYSLSWWLIQSRHCRRTQLTLVISKAMHNSAA